MGESLQRLKPEKAVSREERNERDGKPELVGCLLEKRPHLEDLSYQLIFFIGTKP